MGLRGIVGRFFARRSQDRWTAVDDYFANLLVGSDLILDSALKASAAAALPPINVSPCQGKLLFLMAKAIGARRILEMGTLGGYSTIWLARALPADGCLITLELDPKHAEVARGNFKRAGLADLIDLRLGPALETLPRLAAQGVDPFDLVFLDADKPHYSEYLTGALSLTRAGSLIVADNVVRGGGIVDAASDDAAVQGIRRFNAAVAAEDRLTATAIQTVGAKGYDGFSIILVTRDS